MLTVNDLVMCTRRKWGVQKGPELGEICVVKSTFSLSPFGGWIFTYGYEPGFPSECFEKVSTRDLIEMQNLVELAKHATGE